MSDALLNGSILANEVDYINAHGTGTIVNDRIEAKAIDEVFGEYSRSIHVSSSKPLHGHALGASSAMELISTVLSIKNQLIPPVINYSEKDPLCDLNLVINGPLKTKIDVAFSNSFAFGGLNSSIILKSC